MSDTRPQNAPAKQRQPLHAAIYGLGLAILLVGLAGAVLICVFAADDGDMDAAGEIRRDRMYEHNLELMGGKFAVYLDRFNQWFAGLWHGRSLGFTVAVLAVAIALGCFLGARLVSVTSPSEPDQGREG